MKKIDLIRTVMCAFALLVAQPAVAAPISWTKADISGVSDVETVGELVYAATGHNAGGDLVVNGVTFTEGRIPGLGNSGPIGAARGPGDLEDPDGDYREFLLTSSFTFSGAPIPVTLTGLTPGEPYLVQIWYVDTNGTQESNNRFMRLNDGSGNIVELDDFGGTNNGQFATGTFTADDTTQALSVVYVNEATGATGGWAQLNGLQVRHLRSVEAPRITSITYDPANGSSEVSIKGGPNTRFKLVEAANLDFSEPDRDPVPLLGASVGTLVGGMHVITDEDGKATVQLNLGTAPSTFIRAEETGSIVLAGFDFEADGQGFTASGDWMWGKPASDNGVPGGQVNSGNDESAGAWGTVLGDGGLPVNGGITPTIESLLRSPDIPLAGITGARLEFAAAVDAESGDTLEVRIYDAANDSIIGTIIPFPTNFPASAAWQQPGPFDLPEDADNKTIYLEFRYVGSNAEYLGFYLDDVTISY